MFSMVAGLLEKNGLFLYNRFKIYYITDFDIDGYNYNITLRLYLFKSFVVNGLTLFGGMVYNNLKLKSCYTLNW